MRECVVPGAAEGVDRCRTDLGLDLLDDDADVPAATNAPFYKAAAL